MHGSDIRIAPFSVEHFDALELQSSQAYVREFMTQENLEGLAEQGPAYTVFRGDVPLVCGGVVPIGGAVAVLWSMVSRHAGPSLVSIHRRVQRFLETVEQREVVATCQREFIEGQRWLEMLGFKFERDLGPYGPAGVPHDLYRRVR